jgi:site-specific DNA-methyltransferase (adenine-specific)
LSWVLYEDDCFEVFPSIEDGSIDMILCDLPYGTTACKWDTPLPLDKLWTEYKRIIKDNGAIVLTGNEPFSSYLRMSNIDWYKYDWKWLKNFSGSFILAKKRPMKYHEDIMVFYQSQPTYNPKFREYGDGVKKRYKCSSEVNNHKAVERKDLNNIQSIKRVSPYINYERGAYPKSEIYFDAPPNCNGLRKHPSQKPVKLFEYLIRTYTNEHDLVLDNCAGSGTSGVACQNLNRDCILIEKEPENCDIIRKNATIETLHLNNANNKPFLIMK